jgi:hypothetical protein
MNPHIKRQLNLKNNKWKTYKRHPTPANWSIFSGVRNQLTATIRNAKRLHEEQLIATCKYNKKLLFSYFRGKAAGRPTFNLRRDDGTTSQDPTENVELINNYFSTIVGAAKVGQLPNLIPQTETISDIEIFEEEVLNLLRACDPTKSAGPDSIHNALLNGCASTIAAPLTLIFKKSMIEGYVPEDWRRAHIAPLFKSGDRSLPSNYRPISLTSQVAKLFEKLVKRQLYNFCEDHNIISPKQHGFRAGLSCQSNLLECTNYLSVALDNHSPCDVIFLDISKAFDTVPHDILIRKLENFGIAGNLLRWINSFLGGRKQRVVHEGATSKWSDVASGVPQGTVLGPLLFSLFINDLPNDITSPINLFADDVKLYCVALSQADHANIQRDLDRIGRWADLNGMKFNATKSAVLHFGKNNPRFNYSLAGDTLAAVTEAKSLGVTFTEEFKVKKQCALAARHANQMLGRIKKHFSYFTRDSLKTLYTSYVRPCLEHCVQVWNPQLVKDQQILETVQRRATKMAPGLHALPYHTRLERLGLTTLVARRARGDLLYTYKMLHGLVHCDPAAYFTPAPDLGTRGHRYKLQRGPINTNIGKHCFTRRVIDDWNRLPPAVVEAASVNCWKAAYSKLPTK